MRLLVGAALLVVASGCSASEPAGSPEPPDVTPASETGSPADPESAPAAVPRGGPRIAFTRWTTDPDRPRLWTADSDGSDARPVGRQEGWWPDWRPDHRRLVFDLTDSRGPQRIATIRPDGKGLRILTKGWGYNEAADYAPDGRTIVYAHSDVLQHHSDFATSLWVMAADGSGQRPLRLSDGGGDDTEPEFSPNGRRIVFMRYRHDAAATTAIHVVKADGSGVRRLTPWLRKAEHPRWSPDGRTIIYNVEDRRNPTADSNGIWTVRASGGEPRQLLATTPELHAFKPDYSPNGRWVVMGCTTPGQSSDDVCVMRPDGSGVTRILSGDEWENHVVWD